MDDLQGACAVRTIEWLAKRRSPIRRACKSWFGGMRDLSPLLENDGDDVCVDRIPFGDPHGIDSPRDRRDMLHFGLHHLENEENRTRRDLIARLHEHLPDASR